MPQMNYKTRVNEKGGQQPYIVDNLRQSYGLGSPINKPRFDSCGVITQRCVLVARFEFVTSRTTVVIVKNKNNCLSIIICIYLFFMTTCHTYFNRCNPDSCIKQFIIGSNINGNNGSYTNTDDHDNATRARNNKAAASRRVHGKNVNATGKHSKVSFGPPDIKQGDEISVSSLQDVNDSPLVTTVTYCVYDIDKNGNYVYFLDNKITRMLPCGVSSIDRWVNIQCKRAHLGSYEVSSDPKENVYSCVTTGFTEMRSMESFTMYDAAGVPRTFPAGQYIVMPTLWKKLVSQNFRELNSVTYAAIHSIGRTLGGSDVDEYLSYIVGCTCECFCHLLEYNKYLTTISVWSFRAGNNHSMISTGHTQIGTVGRLGISYNVGGMIFHTYSIVKEHPDYDTRNDFVITGGSSFITLVMSQNGNRNLPIFIIPDDPKVHVRSNWFSFRGKHQKPFIEYSSSTINWQSALKRLIGARPDEQYYRNNAMYLGHSIAREFVDQAGGCGGCFIFWFGGIPADKLINTYYKLIGTRDVSHHDTSGLGFMDWDPGYSMGIPVFNQTGQLLYYKESVFKFIARHMLQVDNRCTMTNLQQLQQMLPGLANWHHKAVLDDRLLSDFILNTRSTVAQFPHEKREERIRYVNGIKFNELHTPIISSISAIPKRELTSSDKRPRICAAYGQGCVHASELPAAVKVCLHGDYSFPSVEGNGIDLVVRVIAKPVKTSMQEVGEFVAVVPNNTLHVVICSDDSVYSLVLNNQKYEFNVDVSSNDSSQDLPSFYMTWKVLSNFCIDRADQLIQQCLTPILVKNPVGSGHFELKFKGPFEGSGSVLTTLLNHIGSIQIALGAAYSINELIESNPDVLQQDSLEVSYHLKRCISDGASYVGHKITCDHCINDGFHVSPRTQFLKHSFMCIDGVIVPARNMGCLLRSIGSVKDDLLPGQLGLSSLTFSAMSQDQKMNAFCGAVIMGWKNEPSNQILRAFRHRFLSSGGAPLNTPLMTHCLTSGAVEAPRHFYDLPINDGDPVDYSSFHSDSFLYERYGLSSYEVQEIVETILNLRVGDIISTSGIAKIYSVDYDIEDVGAV